MSKELVRVKKIIETINTIDFIFNNLDIKITDAIDDALVKPAIRMHIVKIAKQYDSVDDHIIEDVSDMTYLK